jgi:ppGpp synthetase/RelA/SpoT-type nucleotidyltranferase
MTRWAPPIYAREVVNKAACVLISPEDFEYENDFDIISNWRSAHNFPLNTFKIGLLKRARLIDPKSIVAQRLKRLSSIAFKLRRFPEMKLTQMQDIAGCRAILASVADVKKLVEMYKRSDIKHKLVHEDDYIAAPKESGYRSHHLIYRYYSDRSEDYNDLKVEIQIRSKLQHAWATAVETVGTFIQQALKSSQGEDEWLRFFTLMAAHMALREGTSPVPDTPSDRGELSEEIRSLKNKLDVSGHLLAYTRALADPEIVGVYKDSHYFLLELNPNTRQMKVTGYGSDDLPRASRDYLSVEKAAIEGKSGLDAVLVSVESVKALKQAYPNYFLDTHQFLQAIEFATRGKMRRQMVYGAVKTNPSISTS